MIYICDVVILKFFTGLVNGSNALEGRVEIYYNGAWGTVCEVWWSLSDGVVACQQLGAGIAYDIPYDHSFGGNSNISVAASNLVCLGPEGRLQNCGGRFGSAVDSRCTTHTRDAGLVCIDGSKLYSNLNINYSVN